MRYVHGCKKHRESQTLPLKSRFRAKVHWQGSRSAIQEGLLVPRELEWKAILVVAESTFGRRFAKGNPLPQTVQPQPHDTLSL